MGIISDGFMEVTNVNDRDEDRTGGRPVRKTTNMETNKKC